MVLTGSMVQLPVKMQIPVRTTLMTHPSLSWEFRNDVRVVGSFADQQQEFKDCLSKKISFSFRQSTEIHQPQPLDHKFKIDVL